MPKGLRLWDWIASLEVGAVVVISALTTVNLVFQGVDTALVARLCLVLAVGALAWSTILGLVHLLAPAYELTKPFSEPLVLALAGTEVLLAAALGSRRSPEFVLPLLAAAILGALVHGLRQVRRGCTFCAASWRARHLLVGGSGFTLCDQCAEEAGAKSRPPLDANAPRLRCQACSANLPADQFPLRANTVAVCFSCVALAQQVIADGRQSASAA